MDQALALALLREVRKNLQEDPPRIDSALFVLDFAIREWGPIPSYPDDGPLLRGEGPTSPMIGDRRPYPDGPDYPVLHRAHK